MSKTQRTRWGHLRYHDWRWGRICFARCIVYLFTNTPISKSLEIIEQRLQQDTTLKDRTDMEVKDVMTLLEFTLTTTFFLFDGQIFQQKFGTKLKEHKSEAEKASAKAFIRSQRKASITWEPNKSAIRDHVVNTNHVIGWEEATIKDREQDRFKRQIKECTWSRKQGQLHSTKYLWPTPDEKIAIYGQVQTDWPEVGSLAWRSVTL